MYPSRSFQQSALGPCEDIHAPVLGSGGKFSSHQILEEQLILVHVFLENLTCFNSSGTFKNRLLIAFCVRGDLTMFIGPLVVIACAITIPAARTRSVSPWTWLSSRLVLEK